MSFLAKVSTFFGLEDEEYMEEEQLPPQQVVRQQPTSSVKPKNTFKPRATQPTARQTQTVNQPTVDQRSAQKQAVSERPTKQQQVFERPQQSVQNEKKVVSMRQIPTKQPKQTASSNANPGKILIIEPRVYSEAMNIAKHVMGGESVLVNFRLIEEYQARRIVDFLTGTVYAEDGDIKRVADEIFLCTPKGIEIDGTAQSLVDSNMFDI